MNNDHYLDLMEMKQMMEKLGAPQTHVGLKSMIAEIDEDNDGKVSYREVQSQFYRGIVFAGKQKDSRFNLITCLFFIVVPFDLPQSCCR